MKTNAIPKTILYFILSCLNYFANAQKIQTVDICVYGGTSAGVMAAYTAQKSGKSVILIEPTKHLGGLSTGGLGFTDIGNKYAINGLALDFYRRIGQHYGKFEQWIFEPHVAENLFNEYIKRANVKVVFQHRLVSVKKEENVIKQIVIENAELPNTETNLIIKAKMFIDCTYEGDLMAKSGVSYIVGREDNTTYNETYNGVQLMGKHQFLDGIDPYKIKGKPESGLIWGVSAEKILPIGTGNKQVQAYNFRICLSSNPTNQLSILRPANYDSTKYELLLRILEKEPKKPFGLVLKPDLMPNQKTDINNNGGFSTDMIGMNYDFPEADFNKRKQIQKEHELYTKGLLYFIGNDSRMPEHLRKEMKRWGYPKDEYIDNNNWSPQMYVREARRMIGEYVMSQANCQGKEVVKDGIGMAAYTMDSHNCQRIVIEKDGMKMVKNEGDVQIGGFPPYPIAYRSLIPKQKECSNLLVPVCLSASHIAYGSIRMEPVFMVLAQSSALAASMAIDEKVSVQKIDVSKLQNTLRTNPLSDESEPDILIDNENKEQVSIVGDWQKELNPRGCYGPTWLSDTSNNSSERSVKFNTNISKSRSYQVYIYFPKIEKASSKTTINVFDGMNKKVVIVNQSDIIVQGQTSGDWVSIGKYNFLENQKSYVEITNNEADGKVVADAVLLVKIK